MYGSNTFIDRSRSSAEFALSVALDPKHVAALQRLEQGALDDSFFRVVPDRAVRQILIRIIKKRKKIIFFLIKRYLLPDCSHFTQEDIEDKRGFSGNQRRVPAFSKNGNDRRSPVCVACIFLSRHGSKSYDA